MSIEKIKVEQFGEANNYLRLMERAPKIFERIIQLEITVNKLVDEINKLQPKTVNPSPQSVK